MAERFDDSKLISVTKDGASHTKLVAISHDHYKEQGFTTVVKSDLVVR